jgi:hypothetical protein
VMFFSLIGGAYTATNGRGRRRFAESACYLPVPLSCTICVPTASLMFKVAVRAPVAVGLNVTVIVQSEPALRPFPQLDFR